jgi:hypothetical protein
LPARSVIGEGEWRRRYQRLRRAADGVVTPEADGAHVEAFARMLEAIEPGAGSEALVAYGRALARQMDERPSATTGREYRLTCALLLDLAVDGEEADEVEARAQLLRLVSTPSRPA